MLTYVTVIVTA